MFNIFEPVIVFIKLFETIFNVLCMAFIVALQLVELFARFALFVLKGVFRLIKWLFVHIKTWRQTCSNPRVDKKKLRNYEKSLQDFPMRPAVKDSEYYVLDDEANLLR